MQREINSYITRIKPLKLPANRLPNASELDYVVEGGHTSADLQAGSQTVSLRGWLAKRAKRYGLPWLLAHTDSGVIWGQLNNGTLLLSNQAFAGQFVGVELDWTTLQQCRLFGPAGELLIWQAGDGWQARLRYDGTTNGTNGLALDETHLLWGTQQEGANQGFLLLAEGSQGIVHAPPLATPPTDAKRAALLIRHYLSEDPATGLLRIGASRLVELQEPTLHPCL